MGDADASKPDVVARNEGVDVKTLANAGFAVAPRKPSLSRREIFHSRHLEISAFALEHMSLRARPFCGRHVVREIGDPSRLRPPMGVKNKRKAKRLRGLDRPQRRARRGREHPALAVDLLDRVADPDSWRRRAILLCRVDRAGDEAGCREGAGGVLY